MLSKLHHAASALGVFVIVTGAILWFSGGLHLGFETAAATEDGHEDHSGHAHAASGHEGEETPHEEGEDWCDEHGVAESECGVCNEEEGDACCPEPGSSLDMAALTELRCEHDVPIVDCDKCRFEVGMVKLDASVADSLVGTGTVEESLLSNTLSVTGEVQLDPTGVTEVPPPGAGRVAEVHAILGQNVQRGDLLAVVHSADLGEARAALTEAQAKRSLTERTMARERELHEKKISSEADYLDARAAYEAARAQCASAEERLRILGPGQDGDRSIPVRGGDLARLEIKAPRSGTIIAHSVSEGEFVDPSESLCTIADLSNLWIWCDVYERDLAPLHAKLAAGETLDATAHVAAFPEAAFRGAVDLIGSTMDEHTRTIKVRVQVENADAMLRPGMFARVSVALPSEEHAVVVPRDAVVSDEGTSFVFQHWKDDLWLRRDVETGREQGDGIVVLAGLAPDARIVTRGAFMLKSDVLRAKMGAGCAD